MSVEKKLRSDHQVLNIEVLLEAADEIAVLRGLLERSHKELMDVLAHLDAARAFHDGDDFHELMNDIKEKL